MKPILATDKNGKEFKGILRKKNNGGRVRSNKQTKKCFQNTEQKTEEHCYEVLQCSHS